MTYLVPDHVLQRTHTRQLTLLGVEIVHEVEVRAEHNAQQRGNDAQNDDAAFVHLPNG